MSEKGLYQVFFSNCRYIFFFFFLGGGGMLKIPDIFGGYFFFWGGEYRVDAWAQPMPV